LPFTSLDDYLKFEKGVEPNWQNFSNPYQHLIVGPSPLRFRIPRVKKEPDFAEIGLILAVDKSRSEDCGIQLDFMIFQIKKE
jgi:hypothetical protein